MNDEFNKSVCKIGGPLVLFVCTPILGYSLFYVINKTLQKGGVLNIKTIVVMSLIIIASAWLGVYACQKGLGWFKGEKW